MWKGTKMRQEMIISYEIIDGLKTGMKNEGELIRCKDCKFHDIFPTDSKVEMPMKCLNIRYGGVYPDWFCEHAERKENE